MTKLQKRLVAAMVLFVGITTILASLLPLLVQTKGDGVGFSMQGTLTNFNMIGENCHFTFTGTFRITQRRGVSRSTVEMDCKRGFSATVTQNWFFVATHPTANAAAVRNNTNALSGILKLAAERKRVIKFELIKPKITFGDRGSITNLESAVVRATDWDLH